MADQEDHQHLLILTTRPNDLRQAAQFLTKRNWKTQVMADMKDAVAYVSNERPDWVLVSANTNGPVEKFCQLLAQNFNVQCILFAESGEPHVMARMSQFRGTVLHGRLSGPSIQMKLRKLIKDRTAQTFDPQVRQRSTGLRHGTDSENDTVRISSKASDETHILSGKSGQRGEAVIMQSGQTAPYGPAYRGGSGQNPDDGGLSAFDDDGRNQEGVQGGSEPSLLARGPTTSGHAISNSQDTSRAPAQPTPRQAPTSPQTSQGQSLAQGQVSAVDGKQQGSQIPIAKRSLETRGRGDRTNQQGAQEPIPVQISSDSGRGVKLANSDRLSPPSLSKLWGLIEQALEMLDLGPANSKAEPAATLNECAVLSVKGEDVSGHLVIGDSFTDANRETILEAFRRNLNLLFNEDGSFMEAFFGLLNLRIEKFPQWAQSAAEFHFTFPVTAGDVVIAFVPQEDLLPQCIPYSNDPRKVKVDLDEIPADERLPFPLYLHLPENEKYVRLVKMDGWLSERQRLKLLEQNDFDVLMDKIDVPKFEKFFVQQQLANASALSREAA